jgi:UPF0755 protein
LRKLIFPAAAALTVLLLTCGLWLHIDLDTPYYGAPSEEVFIEIPKRANSGQIADLLVDAGVLHYRFPFVLYLRYTGLGRRVQAGEYRFAEPAAPRLVAQRLAKGDVTFRSITIPEGLTARETIDLLAKNGFGETGAMERLLLRTDWIKDIDPKARNLEGYLFPETYRFSRKADAETVLQMMVQQFRKRIVKITAAYPPRPDWTIRRILILASMIEKEAKRTEEGPIVASVLINRLDTRMPLSCDATIIYAMKQAGTYEGRVGKAGLSMESPYNSYTHIDLPPGPISNPGENSLRAALNPAHTNYFYYVSRNDGTHQFSKDLATHQHAVDRFQKNGRRKK